MATPFFARFSFVVFALLLFIGRNASDSRAKRRLRRRRLQRPDRLNRSHSRKRLRKKFGRTKISADLIANPTIHRPPLSRAQMRAPPQRQNQKAKKTRSGITIRSQSCRRKYRLSIRRLPNCRPRSKARRSMSRCTTAAIESVIGKSSCSSLKQSARTRSTKLPPSKTKPATTASNQRASLILLLRLKNRKPRGHVGPRAFFEPQAPLDKERGSSRRQPAPSSGSSAAGFAPGISALPRLSRVPPFHAKLHNACSALRGCSEISDC